MRFFCLPIVGDSVLPVPDELGLVPRVIGGPSSVCVFWGLGTTMVAPSLPPTAAACPPPSPRTCAPPTTATAAIRPTAPATPPRAISPPTPGRFSSPPPSPPPLGLHGRGRGKRGPIPRYAAAPAPGR